MPVQKTIMRQRDRFTYSAGATLSLGGYEFFRFDVGFASDGMKGEPLQKLGDRVVEKVEEFFNKKMAEFEVLAAKRDGKKPKGKK